VAGSYETQALLVFVQFTGPRADIALNASIFQCVPVLGGKEAFGAKVVHDSLLMSAANRLAKGVGK
jgi:hypothetical protein